MLVRFEDTKGKPAWINPIHVKMLRQKKEITEVYVSGTPGWNSPYLKVRMAMDEVADMLNAAMPDMAFVPDDDLAAAQQQAAGAAAATTLLG